MAKVKITFVIPANLQEDLKNRLIEDGYAIREKSRWVAEAVEKLLITDSFPDLVKINDEMKGFEKLESVVISKELKKQVDDAVIDIRKIYPVIEGVQSRILRTAIVQRLLRY